MQTPKSQLQAIIFDWGGVCCSGGEPFASVSLQQKLGKTLEEVTDSAHDIYIDYCKGKYTKEEFWRKVLAHFSLQEDSMLNPDTLSQAYLSSYVPYPDVLSLIAQLKVKYHVSLLSNLTPEMRDHIRATHNTREYFKEETYSCDPDVGVLKPAQEAYKAALKKNGYPPEACLFIDDSVKNISAAREMGMSVIHFVNKEQALKELTNLL